jgi:S1-C subfamily serine protease
LKPGDVIVAIDDKDVSTIDELNEYKNTLSVGDEVTLKIYRNKEYITVTLTLGIAPTEDDSTSSSIQDYYNNYDNLYKYFNNGFGY